MIRWLVLGLLGLLVVGAVSFDRLSPIDVEAADVTAVQEVNPSVARNPRLDGSWFCPVGSSNAGGIANSEIAVANFAATPAIANISVLTGDGPVPPVRIEIPPFGSETTLLSSYSDSEVAGAVVEIIGGDGVVGHSIETSEGVAQGVCSTQVSDSWYFANGRTTEDSQQYITLMNPFEDSAVYDVEFRIPGRPAPLRREALQGQGLPAKSIVRLDIGEVVTGEDNIAVQVTTRRGQIVAERLQVIDGSREAQGASLQLGVPQPAQSWIFPAGRLNSEGADEIVVWNPSPDEATTVEVGFWPVDPADRATFSLTPIERELPPGRFEVIDLLSEGQDFGLEIPYELAVTVSSNNAGVVAERWHYGKAYSAIVEEKSEEDGEDATEADEAEADEAPAEEGAEEVESPYLQSTASTGLATSRGVEVVSDRWIVPWAFVDGAQLSITAASDAEIEVEVQAGGQLLAETIQTTIAAGGRAVIDIDAIASSGSVKVESSSSVAVELQYVNEDGAVDIVPAIPTV